MDNDTLIQKVEAVLMKYCVPAKAYDHIPPKQVAQELIDVVKAALDTSAANSAN